MEELTKSNATHIVPSSHFEFIVPQEDDLSRLDNFVAKQFPYYSRSFFKRLITENLILVNAKPVAKAGAIIKINDTVNVTFPKAHEKTTVEPKVIDSLGVSVLLQHKDFLILNKPAGLLVHAPSEKCTEPTLVDWLLHHFEKIKHVGYDDRPGIVHRLDQDTSGVIIVPLTNEAHGIFGDFFKNRTIQKTYYAIVQGHPDPKGTINFSIGRHPQVRNKMTRRYDGRASTTHYEVETYFKNEALVKVKPVTGRTHQIRVHLRGIGYPIFGDEVYGVPSKNIKRQALHASSISFEYKKETFFVESPLPNDFQVLLSRLKKFEE